MNLQAFLANLDLSQYETALIETLARHHALAATELSRKSGVPQGRIYDVLSQLTQKSIVKVIPGRPKRYEIPDVQAALEAYLRSLKEEIAGRIDALKQMDRPAREFTRPQAQSVYFYSGRDEHLQAIRNLHDCARKSVCQIAPLFIGSFATKLARTRARERGARIRVITKARTSANKAAIEHALAHGIEVRTLKRPDLLSMVIVDGSEFLLGVQDHRLEEERLLLHGRNPAVIEALKEAFEKQWRAAVPVRP